MSLTNAEASAVNDLLTALTGKPSTPYSPADVPDDALIETASLLADHASKRLMVGWNGERAADAVRAMLAKQAREEALTTIHPSVMAWDLMGTRAIVGQRLDGHAVYVDGEEWHMEVLVGDSYDGDELLLTHPSGRQIHVRVRAIVCGGLDVVQELAARPIQDLQLPADGGGAA